jgi:hypothetical protein
LGMLAYLSLPTKSALPVAYCVSSVLIAASLLTWRVSALANSLTRPSTASIEDTIACKHEIRPTQFLSKLRQFGVIKAGPININHYAFVFKLPAGTKAFGVDLLYVKIAKEISQAEIHKIANDLPKGQICYRNFLMA